MKTSLRSRLVLAVSFGVLFAAAASAGPITLPSGSWQTEPFTFMNSGDVFPTAYQASVAGSVNITGYYVTGDYYEVFINQVLALTTKQVGPLDVDYGDSGVYADPASGFASGLFSTGQFTVSAGDVITIADLYPPSGIGEVGVLFTPTSAAPEPSTYALLGVGFLSAIFLRRRVVTRLPV